ncbi:hypothetical protein ACHAQH_010093 [Verticillium albo-atrum]
MIKAYHIRRHAFLTDIDEGRLLPMEASDAKNVLDVGTGTGDWALDVSDANADITITGTDLAAIQPSSIPSNVTFYVDDANDPFWGWDDRFDFVHMRGLNGGIKKWIVTLRAAFRCLRAGGVIEVSDMDFHPAGPLAPGSAWLDWSRMLQVLTDATGLDVGIHKDGRGQHELEELGYQFPVQSRREYQVGYETHVYGDRSLLASVVEQMKGILARAVEFVPWSASLDDLMRRLETEILDKGLIIEVNKLIAKKPGGW